MYILYGFKKYFAFPTCAIHTYGKSNHGCPSCESNIWVFFVASCDLPNFALFLFFLCCCTNDCYLLNIRSEACTISNLAVVLHLRFGLKQDCQGHVSPRIHLLYAPDTMLSPCSLPHSVVFRSFHSSADIFRFFCFVLFWFFGVFFSISAVLPGSFYASKDFSLARVCLNLKGAGVDASPRSSWAALASYGLASGHCPNVIMESADLASPSTVS